MTRENKTPPILLLAFNRADVTAKVLDAIRPARPERLYFAVDGPRDGRAEDFGAVRAVQDLSNAVDWPCEVITLFNERNLGCKLAVSQAITWFFEHEEAGIILEDDCVAHPTFFPFCQQLLYRYKDDQRIVLISGNNFQFGRRRTEYSYYYSRYNHIWGWASWRRAWELYDHSMSLWPEVRDGGWLEDILGDRVAAKYWTHIFNETHAEKNTSWAYRWTFACWVNNGLSILPNRNLVSNIGFGDLATHTLGRSRLEAIPTEPMTFPLSHPRVFVRDTEADRLTERVIFSRARPAVELAKKLAKLLGIRRRPALLRGL